MISKPAEAYTATPCLKNKTKTALPVRARPALAEDSGSVTRTHTWQFTNTSDSSSRASDAHGPPWSPHKLIKAHIDTQTLALTNKSKKARNLLVLHAAEARTGAYISPRGESIHIFIKCSGK